MREDEGFPEPISSQQWPIPVPTSDPDVGTLHYAFWNDEYTQVILGCLTTMVQQYTWDTTDPATLYQAQARAMTLINQIGIGIDMFTPGMVMPYAGSSAPANWLMCDGSAVSRTTYAALFAAIGTVYGPGDGSTTFNLPGSPGRALIGAGTGSGLSPRALGVTGGEETHQLTVAELASHSHADAGHSHSTGNSLLIGTQVPPPLDGLGPNPLPAFTGSASANIQNTGGDGAHNNMQPFLALNFIIHE